jgi:ethanolamine permease
MSYVIGGSYGIARVTLGIFPGYLVGCCDSIESVMYVSVSAVAIGAMISEITHWPSDYEPLYWFFFYATALGIQVWGGRLFWTINKAMALVSFFIIIAYIFGGIKFADFSKNAAWRVEGEDNSGADLWFQGGINEFMRVLPLPCWFFVGVESLNLAGQEVHKPKEVIPPGYISCIATLFCTCFGVLFVAVSQNPGVPELQAALNPLNYGFKNMLGCSDEVATLISLPATYATAFGFMFCYGKQLRSMGKSGLLNHYMGHDLESRNTPVVALLVGSGVGYLVCILIWLVPAVGDQMFNVSMLGAFGAYFSQLLSFIELRRTYTGEPLLLPAACCLLSTLPALPALRLTPRCSLLPALPPLSALPAHSSPLPTHVPPSTPLITHHSTPLLLRPHQAYLYQPAGYTRCSVRACRVRYGVRVYLRLPAVVLVDHHLCGVHHKRVCVLHIGGEA